MIDVLDEHAARHVGQLGGAVTADRHDLAAILREGGGKNPAVVLLHSQHFLPRRDLDDVNGVVGAAESQLRAVRRERRAEQGVSGQPEGAQELALGHVPQFHFAEGGGRTADRRQHRPVGREGERGDFVGDARQPRHQAGPVALVQQHLAVTGDRQQAAVRRVGQRRDHRGGVIGHRLPRLDDAAAFSRSVVLGAVANPAAKQVNLRRRKRRLAEGHLRLFGAREVGDQEALVGLAGPDHLALGPAVHEPFVGGQGKLALLDRRPHNARARWGEYP